MALFITQFVFCVFNLVFTVPSKLYHIGLCFLYLFLCVCVHLFFNLSLKLPSCYCFLFFLLKCLPYFRENGTFRLNVLNFTTYDTTCPQNVSGQYCTSKSLEMISESKLFVSSLKFASENYCMCTETLK